jgi:hypothetical protein
MDILILKNLKFRVLYELAIKVLTKFQKLFSLSTVRMKLNLQQMQSLLARIFYSQLDGVA